MPQPLVPRKTSSVDDDDDDSKSFVLVVLYVSIDGSYSESRYSSFYLQSKKAPIAEPVEEDSAPTMLDIVEEMTRLYAVEPKHWGDERRTDYIRLLSIWRKFSESADDTVRTEMLKTSDLYGAYDDEVPHRVLVLTHHTYEDLP